MALVPSSKVLLMGAGEVEVKVEGEAAGGELTEGLLTLAVNDPYFEEDVLDGRLRRLSPPS